MSALQIVVWLVMWFAACIIGDMWLELQGEWMMVWGVAAYELCCYVNDKLERK
jgi:hypothetical protein